MVIGSLLRLILNMTVRTMPATIATTIAFLNMIQFGKYKIRSFHIVMDAFNQFRSTFGKSNVFRSSN
jgi:hypothetical protein